MLGSTPVLNLVIVIVILLCFFNIFFGKLLFFFQDKCHSGAFSPDGNLVATGSVDASIKILDVDRMLAKSDPDAVEIHPDAIMGHPVIRTLYDHLDEITCLEFHPKEQVCVCDI